MPPHWQLIGISKSGMVTCTLPWPLRMSACMAKEWPRMTVSRNSLALQKFPPQSVPFPCHGLSQISRLTACSPFCMSILYGPKIYSHYSSLPPPAMNVTFFCSFPSPRPSLSNYSILYMATKLWSV